MVIVCSKMKTLLHSIIATIAICELSNKRTWVVPQGVKGKPIAQSRKALVN
jgi:hypothetical protein